MGFDPGHSSLQQVAVRYGTSIKSVAIHLGLLLFVGE
jgi:hypothetical protein